MFDEQGGEEEGKRKECKLKEKRYCLDRVESNVHTSPMC